MTALFTSITIHQFSSLYSLSTQRLFSQWPPRARLAHKVVGRTRTTYKCRSRVPGGRSIPAVRGRSGQACGTPACCWQATAKNRWRKKGEGNLLSRVLYRGVMLHHITEERKSWSPVHMYKLCSIFSGRHWGKESQPQRRTNVLFYYMMCFTPFSHSSDKNSQHLWQDADEAPRVKRSSPLLSLSLY